MSWRCAARKPSYGQVEASPEQVHRTHLSEESSAKRFEDAVDLQDAADAELPIGNMDLLLQRLMLTYVFDAMIYNIDRNFNNILVRPASDDFFLIDHSRAFRTKRKLPTLKDPRATKGPNRTIRGGAYSDRACNVSSYFRRHIPPDEGRAWLGFRCAGDSG